MKNEILTLQVVGPRSSGKTTLIKAIEPVLEKLGYEILGHGNMQTVENVTIQFKEK